MPEYSTCLGLFIHNEIWAGLPRSLLQQSADRSGDGRQNEARSLPLLSEYVIRNHLLDRT